METFHVDFIFDFISKMHSFKSPLLSSGLFFLLSLVKFFAVITILSKHHGLRVFRRNAFIHHRFIRTLLILFSKYSTWCIFIGTRQFTHSFKSLSRSYFFPHVYFASSSFLSFLLAIRLLSSHFLRHALGSHDVTRVGITHEDRVVYQGDADVSWPEREGRDSFEPRLVFASPCVPRTSYFNETVCPPFPLFLFYIFSLLPTSPPLPLCSFPLAISLVSQPTDRPVGLSSRTISSRISFFPLSFPPRFSCSRAPISGGCARFFLPSPAFARLSQKASHRLRIRRTAVMILRTVEKCDHVDFRWYYLT